MNPASKDLGSILAAADLGLTVSTSLFIGQEPASPPAQADTVTIYDTPGHPPMLTQDRAERYDMPAIQIRVRNTNYLAGYAMINSIKETLHGLAHFVQDGVDYELVKCDQDPFLLDYDESGRPRFICNFSIQRRPQ